MTDELDRFSSGSESVRDRGLDDGFIIEERQASALMARMTRRLVAWVDDGDHDDADLGDHLMYQPPGEGNVDWYREDWYRGHDDPAARRQATEVDRHEPQTSEPRRSPEPSRPPGQMGWSLVLAALATVALATVTIATGSTTVGIIACGGLAFSVCAMVVVEILSRQ